VYIAVKKTELPNGDVPPMSVINKVFYNLILTEVFFFLAWLYDFPVGVFSFTNLVIFYIVQDIYFYLVHKFIFHGPLYFMHKRHHERLDAYAAWYASTIEHILLNIGSIAVPFWLFPNATLVFLVIILQQIYTSVDGHTLNSPHSVHHKDITRRFGSIYLLDRLFGSF